MNVTNMDPAALNAALEAAMKQAEEKASSNSSPIVRIENPGRYRIRILPDRDTSRVEWWATYGMHYIKALIPGQKGKMFLCDYHTHNKPCAVCEAVQAVKAKAKADPANPQLAALLELAKRAYAGPIYVANAILVDRDPNAIVPLQFKTLLREKLFSFARMVDWHFFRPENNYEIVVDAKPHSSGNGLDFEIVGRGQPVNLGDVSGRLYDLKKVIADETQNMTGAAVFTGDFTAPLPLPGPATSGTIGYGGSIAPSLPAAAPAVIPAPAAVPAQPAPQPVPSQGPAQSWAPAQPAPQPAPQPAAFAVPAQPAPQPVAQPIPVVAPQPQQAAPVQQPVPAAPTPDVQAAAQPIVPNADAMAELEKKLLAMAAS